MNNAIINNNQFLLVKSQEECSNAFANLSCGQEQTFIVEQSKLTQMHATEIQTDFRLITFDNQLPSQLSNIMNFMFTKITGTTSYPHVITAHETNHLVIKNIYLDKAKDQLHLLGFKVIEI